ncbi:MAG: hypothetical protein C4320_07855 [Armatimonadota bacterium]
MPYINLVEVHRIADRRQARTLRTGVLALAGTTLFAAIGYATVQFQIQGLLGEEKTLRANVEKLKPLLSEIEAGQKERANLEPRLKMLADAQKLTGRWARIMAHLATNTPQASWLTGMRCSADAEHPISLSLAGVGRQQADAAEFMLRTQNARDLENVQLRFTQEKMLGTSSAIEFEVGADIVDTAPPKIIKDAPAEGAKS